MSYVDILNDAAARADAASTIATAAADILDEIANGPETATVTTANGEVDTVAKAINDVKEAIAGGATAPVLEQVTLADSQTEVTFNSLNTSGIALYIDDGSVDGGYRYFDFTVTSTNSVSLGSSFTAGTVLFGISTEIGGEVGTAVQQTEANAQLAQDWATLTGSTVDGIEFSSKHYAQESAASATDAAISETNAETSAQNAAISAISADTAADAANQSLSNAQAAAQNAEDFADNAETSAQNAATSENTAEDWATLTGSTVDGTEFSSKHYAQESSQSATDAANSAINASGSASDAQQSATNAQSSATDAAQSATDSANSAIDSANSAASSQQSADNAANSATQALTSSQNAASSASDAEQSAISASNSATGAASSAISASNSAEDAQAAADFVSENAQTIVNATFFNSPTVDLDFKRGKYLSDDGELIETSDFSLVGTCTRSGSKWVSSPNKTVREVPANTVARDWDENRKPKGVLFEGNQHVNIVPYSEYDGVNYPLYPSSGGWQPGSIEMNGITMTRLEANSAAGGLLFERYDLQSFQVFVYDDGSAPAGTVSTVLFASGANDVNDTIGKIIYFDHDTKTFFIQTLDGSLPSPDIWKVEDWGNGFYRVMLTMDFSPLETGDIVQFGVIAPPGPPDEATQYLYVGGFQSEQDFPTSYKSTKGVNGPSGTSQDLTLSYDNTGAIYNSGTFYLEFSMDTIADSTDKEIMYVGSNNAANGYLQFNINYPDSDVSFTLFDANNTNISNTVVPLGYQFDGSPVKIACSVDWENNVMISAVNGQSSTTTITSGDLFDISLVNFGDSNGGGSRNSRIHYGRFAYHPDILNATQIEALTL